MKTMYVYILKCVDDSFYLGVTYELFNDPLSAIAFEKKLKGWSKKKKQALIESNWDRLKELSVCMNDSHSRNAF